MRYTEASVFESIRRVSGGLTASTMNCRAEKFSGRGSCGLGLPEVAPLLSRNFVDFDVLPFSREAQSITRT